MKNVHNKKKMDCCKTKEDEGCCKDLDSSNFLGNINKKCNSNKFEGGEKMMNTRITLWMVIGILFIIALFLAFSAGTTASVNIAPAASSAPSFGGMVGGC